MVAESNPARTAGNSESSMLFYALCVIIYALYIHKMDRICNLTSRFASGCTTCLGVSPCIGVGYDDTYADIWVLADGSNKHLKFSYLRNLRSAALRIKSDQLSPY